MVTETVLVRIVEEYVFSNPPPRDILYLSHVDSVRNYALLLASKIKSDKLVVELTALLHDIGKTKDLKNHHIESAKIAEPLLRKHGCDEKTIQKVVNCILTHRAERDDKAETIEAQIIKDADGIAFLDIETGTWIAFLYYMWLERKLSFEEGVKKTIIKTENMYEKIETEEGKSIASSNYNKIKSLLSFPIKKMF
ncbi:MAG: HD domain-containing protein [Candidatus Aenigmatarchaeota archaeon]